MSGKAARNAKNRKQTILLTDEAILRIVKLCIQEMFPERISTVEKWLDIAEDLARKVDTELCHLNGNDSNLDGYYTMVAIQNARNALHNIVGESELEDIDINQNGQFVNRGSITFHNGNAITGITDTTHTQTTPTRETE